MNGQKSKMQLLTQKSWVKVKYERKQNNENFIDAFPNFLTCEKDDKLTFRTDNSVIWDPLEECGTEQLSIGGWSFTENDTKIIFGFWKYSILQLDDNTLVLSETNTVVSGIYTIKITYSH